MCYFLLVLHRRTWGLRRFDRCTMFVGMDPKCAESLHACFWLPTLLNDRLQPSERYRRHPLAVGAFCSLSNFVGFVLAALDLECEAIGHSVMNGQLLYVCNNSANVHVYITGLLGQYFTSDFLAQWILPVVPPSPPHPMLEPNYFFCFARVARRTSWSTLNVGGRGGRTKNQNLKLSIDPGWPQGMPHQGLRTKDTRVFLDCTAIIRVVFHLHPRWLEYVCVSAAGGAQIVPAIPIFVGRVGAASSPCWAVVGHCECGMQV